MRVVVRKLHFLDSPPDPTLEDAVNAIVAGAEASARVVGCQLAPLGDSGRSFYVVLSTVDGPDEATPASSRSEGS